MWQAIKDWVNTLLENVPVLLIVAGLALFLLGAAGGISPWIPVKDNMGREFLGGGGILCVIIGILMLGNASKSSLKVSKYGLKITQPIDNDRFDRVVIVRGTFKHMPPKGYEVRLLRIYPKSQEYRPMQRVTLNPSQKTWEAANCDLGTAKRDEVRIIGLYLVGPSGIMLFDYFREAENVHRRTRSELEKLGGTETDFLPLLAAAMKTTDMYECQHVNIVRA